MDGEDTGVERSRSAMGGIPSHIRDIIDRFNKENWPLYSLDLAHPIAGGDLAVANSHDLHSVIHEAPIADASRVDVLFFY